MFTKVIGQQDLPLQVGESSTMHDFLIEVSQDRYKGVSAGTVWHSRRDVRGGQGTDQDLCVKMCGGWHETRSVWGLVVIRWNDLVCNLWTLYQ